MNKCYIELVHSLSLDVLKMSFLKLLAATFTMKLIKIFGKYDEYMIYTGVGLCH